MNQGLPHYLRTGLRVVFIGYNPSLISAELGRYYARPGNVFWRHLSASGLLSRTVGPQDDELLLSEAAIGLTDLCTRPTVSAKELEAEEIAVGAVRLETE